MKVVLLAMDKYTKEDKDLKVKEDNHISELYTFSDKEELLFTAQEMARQGYEVCIMM